MVASDVRCAPPAVPLELLEAIQQRVLCLSMLIIHHANKIRPNPGGIKVAATKRPVRR